MNDFISFEDYYKEYIKIQKKRPVRYFFRITIRRWWNICVRGPWYSFKCRLWHKYNTIRIESLPPTWSDRDEVLLHGAFQVLKDFVEKEDPFELFDASWHKSEWLEIRNLYTWWTIIRPAREDYNIHTSLDTRDKYDKEDEEMLVKLVKLRSFLWT
jgi:hypothetical protein